MKVRQYAVKTLALVLTLSMLLGLLPISALAAVPGAGMDSAGAYKNMNLHSAANHRPISTYTYADSTNYFNTGAAIDPANPGGLEWMLLWFAIEKNQPATLELYEYSGGTELSNVLEPNMDESLEPFLNQDAGKIGNLNVYRVTDDILPREAPANQKVSPDPEFDRLNLDYFMDRYVNGHTPAAMIDVPIYGHEGKPLIPAEVAAMLAELAMPEDLPEALEPAPEVQPDEPEDLPQENAPEASGDALPETPVDTDAEDENAAASDAGAPDAADDAVNTAPDEDSEATPAEDTDAALAAALAIAPLRVIYGDFDTNSDTEPASDADEPAGDAEPDAGADPEQIPEQNDATDPAQDQEPAGDADQEPAAEPDQTPEPVVDPEPIPEHEPTVEPEQTPEPEPTPEPVPTPEPAPEATPAPVEAPEEIQYYDSVRFSSDAFAVGLFADTPAGSGEADPIRNYMFWDGSLVDDSGKKVDFTYEVGKRYVIVFQPTTDISRIYNTFLAFEVLDSADARILNPEEFPGLWEEWPGDPVNLLTGSFSWNYTDFALYGKNDLEFIRYYESSDAANDHGFGKGWSSNFSYGLTVDLLYADFMLPGGKHIYFTYELDGTYSAKDGSAYSMEVTDGSYVVQNRDGTTYVFSRDNSKPEQTLEKVTYLDGNTVHYTYDGDKLTGVSNDTGSFTFTYTGDHVTKVTDINGRSVTLAYDGDFLASATNPDSDDLAYTYTGDGFLERV